MNQLSSSRVLRLNEVADRLGISRVTLWRWERAGHLPPKRQIGPNVVGWLESEIDTWLEATSPEADGKEVGARSGRPKPSSIAGAPK